MFSYTVYRILYNDHPDFKEFNIFHGDSENLLTFQPEFVKCGQDKLFLLTRVRLIEFF